MLPMGSCWDEGKGSDVGTCPAGGHAPTLLPISTCLHGYTAWETYPGIGLRVQDKPRTTGHRGSNWNVDIGEGNREERKYKLT